MYRKLIFFHLCNLCWGYLIAMRSWTIGIGQADKDVSGLYRVIRETETVSQRETNQRDQARDRGG